MRYFCARLACLGVLVTSAAASADKGATYVVTIHGAEIASHRPDGMPWHIQRPDPSLKILGTIVGLSYGQPNLGGAVGSLLAGGDKVVTPAARVEVRFAASTFMSFVHPSSLTPTWNFSFRVDERRLARDESVRLVVRDAVDDGVIAEGEVRGERLLTPGDQLLRLPNLPALQVSVRRETAETRRTYRFQIGAAESLEALVKRAAKAPRFPEDWQPIPVLNGDVVHLRVTGRTCPAFDKSRCSGPGGFPGAWASYSLKGFEGYPHAALVGVYGGKQVLADVGGLIRIDAPGLLLLGVNDSNTSNNSGDGLWVEATVVHVSVASCEDIRRHAMSLRLMTPDLRRSLNDTNRDTPGATPDRMKQIEAEVAEAVPEDGCRKLSGAQKACLLATTSLADDSCKNPGVDPSDSVSDETSAWDLVFEGGSDVKPASATASPSSSEKSIADQLTGILAREADLNNNKSIGDEMRRIHEKEPKPGDQTSDLE